MSIDFTQNLWTSTSDSTAADHNHTVYMDEYASKPANSGQWYVYNDSDMKIGKLVEIIDALWKTLKPYIDNSSHGDAVEIGNMIQAVKNDNGYGMHYGNSAWEPEEKPIVDKELEDLFEI